MNFAARIEMYYPHLTNSERKVASYILNNKETVINQTMQDVKKKTDVGDATIIRFCQKIGLSGFTDLKIEIAKEDFQRQLSHSNSSTFLQKPLDITIQTLEKTNSLLNEASLTNATNAISKADHILIYGVGSSAISAMDLEKLFLRVGKYANSYTDPHVQAQTASLATEKDLIIAFSLTGRTIDIYDSLLIASENNVPIIAITNHIDSPIALLSTIILQSSVEEFLDGGSIQGRISQMHIMDILIRIYEQKISELSVTKRERILRAVLNKRMPD